MDLFGSQTTNKPWMPKYVKKGLKKVTGDAMDWYKKDQSQGYGFQGQDYANFTRPTLDAFGGLTTLAGNNSNGNGMAPELQSIMTGGGFNPGQRGAIDSMRALADNPAQNALINGNGLTADQNDAYGRLKSTVTGNNGALQGIFKTGGLTADQQAAADRYRTGMNEEFGLDPAYLRVKQQAMDAQNDALALRSAGAGRYGGGIDQAIAAREAGNLSDRMDVAEMDKWRARTDAAAANLAGLSQTGTSNMLGINSAQQAGERGLVDVGQLGVGNQASAIGQRGGLESSIFNAENAGLDRMGQAYQTAIQPYMTQRAVGLEGEQQDQKRIANEMRKTELNNPMNRYRDYLSFLTGTPSGQTQTTDPALMSLIAGGGLGILGLGGLFSGLGGNSAPAGSGAV